MGLIKRFKAEQRASGVDNRVPSRCCSPEGPETFRMLIGSASLLCLVHTTRAPEWADTQEPSSAITNGESTVQKGGEEELSSATARRVMGRGVYFVGGTSLSLPSRYGYGVQARKGERNEWVNGRRSMQPTGVAFATPRRRYRQAYGTPTGSVAQIGSACGAHGPVRGPPPNCSCDHLARRSAHPVAVTTQRAQRHLRPTRQ